MRIVLIIPSVVPCRHVYCEASPHLRAAREKKNSGVPLVNLVRLMRFSEEKGFCYLPQDWPGLKNMFSCFVPQCVFCRFAGKVPEDISGLRNNFPRDCGKLVLVNEGANGSRCASRS